MAKNTASNNINSENQNYIKNKFLFYTLIGVLIGIVFPVLAILLEVQVKEFEFKFTFYKISLIHERNPVLYIVDLAPFVLGFIFYILAKINYKREITLHEALNKTNDIIEKNSAFAQKIGEGEFNIESELVSDENILGKSLLIMRDNLVNTYQRENEQNYIAKGKEIIGDILRQRNVIEDMAFETTVNLIEYINAIQGAFYLYDEENDLLVNIATYAYNRKKYIKQEFKIGQGLVGQAAFERDIIYRKEIPNNYISISSGILGDKKPQSILLSPLINDEKLQGVIEFASLENEIPEKVIKLVKEVSEIIAQTIFNLKVNTRTEKLLFEAQDMTRRLQKNEEELRKNAQEMQRAQFELEDINKKLEAQIAEVERGQKRLFSLLENASEVISIYNENGIVTYESPSVKHILGYAPEEIMGQNGLDRYDETANSILRDVFMHLLEYPETPQTFEIQYKKSEEDLLWLETTGRNLLKDTAIQGIIFNTRDITVRKIAEKAQRMSGEMQALSENSPDMILRLSPEGKFFYVNPIVELITGISKNELIKKKLNEVNINKQILNFFTDSLTKVIALKSKYETETNFPVVDGEDRIVQFNAIPEYNKEQELETVLFVAHDITERKQIEIEIEEKNKNITESINYAQRIQSAIIPDTNHILNYLPNSFVFYRPRDVVSGDFPWFFVNGDDVYIAAVDCTGHGVPGALLSFIGYFILNSIADHDKEQTAAEILDDLHTGVRKTLKQDSPDADARDGMDIALCKINFKKKELHFSGAHRPLYHIDNKGEFNQFKGSLQAIGGIPSRKGKEKKFENHIINFNLGEKIFFFSDGLPDQIGGEDGRKYRSNRIKDVISENPGKTMNEYKDIFENDFFSWMGNNKQIDDILLIGIQF